MTPICLLLCLLSSGAEQPWPQWRGPQRDGTVAHFNLPTRWPDQPAKLWSLSIGKGYGSPIVAAGHIYVLSNTDDTEHLHGISLKTGKSAWKVSYPISFKENPAALRFGNGPFSTPLYHQGRVFTVGTTGQIHCLDAASGKVLWKKTYNGDLTDTRKYFCGNSVSPIIYGNTVIVHIGNESEGIMSAFDVESGAEKWQWRGDIPGYASPVIAKVAGEDHMVTLTQKFLNGFDPKTGTLLWQVPFTSTWRENAISPMVMGDTVIISGVERQTMALALSRKKGKWKTEKRWVNQEEVLYMSNPVLYKGTLYGMSYKGKGRFFAMDAATGKTQWQGPARMGKNAAVQLIGNQVAALSTDARLRLFTAQPSGFALVKEYSFDLSTVWAEPVFFDGKMLVKDDESLHLYTFAIGKK
ncbi:PQQ-binding-like beta-propeller repeat protein [Acanthopleuribacter pedis]|uniref:PQQ-binding-like beta-propeller repeat protein n=1 Tax=Acanthopleuribacter pedis TaxID=442870 RepID=A0A8J7QE32_9BACT|nr:PQQ-binding-like beta-propeller repeat protein [Acanthopleuribacter pedis]MBO1317423.1 PQQ-binding-like beta-propeller repeat protein [Acanthopleuribacter pedis]